MHSLMLLLASNLGASVPSPVVVQAQLQDLTQTRAMALTTTVSDASLGVEVAPNRIVFVDRVAAVVLVADFSRDSLWQVGRSGAGPGEFRAPLQPRRDARGGAVVPDAPNARALGISPEGRVTGLSLTRTELGGLNPAAIRGVDAAGRALVFGRGPSGSSDSLGIYRVGPEEKTPTLIGWWPVPRSALGPAVRMPDGQMGRELGIPSALPSRTSWEMLPSGGVVLIRPDPYRAEIIRIDGRVISGPALPYTPVRVTALERDHYRKQRGPTPDASFPRVWPPFIGIDDVVVASDDETWVRRLGAWDATTPQYDVFAADGHYRGCVLFRSGARLIAVGRIFLYLAWENPVDGLIHLLRMPKPTK